MGLSTINMGKSGLIILWAVIFSVFWKSIKWIDMKWWFETTTSSGLCSSYHPREGCVYGGGEWWEVMFALRTELKQENLTVFTEAKVTFPTATVLKWLWIGVWMERDPSEIILRDLYGTFIFHSFPSVSHYWLEGVGDVEFLKFLLWFHSVLNSPLGIGQGEFP